MAKKKTDNLTKISPSHAEALANLGARPEFKTFQQFLRTQQNNIAVISWFRTKRTDPELVIKKSYYEGQFDTIKMILKTFEEIKKRKEE